MSVITKQLSHLNKQQKHVHESLMKEQTRASNKRKGGEKKIDEKKWCCIKSKTKLGRTNTTHHKNKSQIMQKRADIINQHDNIYVSERIVPKIQYKSKKCSQ